MILTETYWKQASLVPKEDGVKDDPNLTIYGRSSSHYDARPPREGSLKQ
jgi:hypothetical protein